MNYLSSRSTSVFILEFDCVRWIQLERVHSLRQSNVKRRVCHRKPLDWNVFLSLVIPSNWNGPMSSLINLCHRHQHRRHQNQRLRLRGQSPTWSKWKERMESKCASRSRNKHGIVSIVSIPSIRAIRTRIKSINSKRIQLTTSVSVQKMIRARDHGRMFPASRRVKHHPVHWKVRLTSVEEFASTFCSVLLAPNINEITSNSCVFNWQAHKSMSDDPISYILQLQVYRKENDYTEIYHGELTSYRATNLEAGVDYRARVCAIRSTSEGLSLNSPFSPATHFVLPRPEDLAHALSASRSSSYNNHLLSNEHYSHDSPISWLNRTRLLLSRKVKSIQLFETRTLTDQQWAIVIFVGFTLLAIFIAIFANVIYSKYNYDSTLAVENAFTPPTPSSSLSPDMNKQQWNHFNTQHAIGKRTLLLSIHPCRLDSESPGSFPRLSVVVRTVKCWWLASGYWFWRHFNWSVFSIDPHHQPSLHIRINHVLRLFSFSSFHFISCLFVSSCCINYFIFTVVSHVSFVFSLLVRCSLRSSSSLNVVNCVCVCVKQVKESHRHGIYW